MDDPSLADHDRPLAPRGEKAVRRLHDYVKRVGYRPDVVMCSSARRTVDTSPGFAPRCRSEPASRCVTTSTWPTPARYWLRCTASTNQSAAVFIGHNPGLEDLAVRLVGEGDDRLRTQLAAKFPTGALAALSFEGGWAELRNRCSADRRLVRAPLAAM